jgi:4-hydroxybenzoate polyprenyltransferase
LAKDFGDVTGDRVAGRRTHTVVAGIRRASWRLTMCTAAVAAGFGGAAWLVDATLIPAAFVVAVGAAGVITWCLAGLVHRRPRVPYQMYMFTQYLAHSVVLIPAAATVLVG